MLSRTVKRETQLNDPVRQTVIPEPKHNGQITFCFSHMLIIAIACKTELPHQTPSSKIPVKAHLQDARTITDRSRLSAI